MLRKVVLLLAAVGILSLVALPKSALAVDFFDDIPCQKAPGSAACRDAGGGDPITGDEGAIMRVTRLVAAVAAVAAVIIIVWAGLAYITSGGDSAKAKTARETIIYAAIGLAVIAIAQALVAFILTNI